MRKELEAVLGMPLPLAEEYLEKAGYSKHLVEEYISQRGKAGKDVRVLRAWIEDDTVRLLVGFFLTEC